jgi:hypothetical protein
MSQEECYVCLSAELSLQTDPRIIEGLKARIKFVLEHRLEVPTDEDICECGEWWLPDRRE